jgi:hypothetical protein
MTDAPRWRQPSALVPMLMSVAALGLLGSVLALHAVRQEPVVREADEGTAAHLWQLLMGGQLPIVAWFFVRWMPTNPRRALPILVVQLLLALAAAFPVWYYQL